MKKPASTWSSRASFPLASSPAGLAASGPRACGTAAAEEPGEEVEEVLGVDDVVEVDVGGRLAGEERGEEVEEVLRVDRGVVVEVGEAAEVGTEPDEPVADAGLGGTEVRDADPDLLAGGEVRQGARVVQAAAWDAGVVVAGDLVGGRAGAPGVDGEDGVGAGIGASVVARAAGIDRQPAGEGGGEAVPDVGIGGGSAAIGRAVVVGASEVAPDVAAADDGGGAGAVVVDRRGG